MVDTGELEGPPDPFGDDDLEDIRELTRLMTVKHGAKSPARASVEKLRVPSPYPHQSGEVPVARPPAPSETGLTHLRVVPSPTTSERETLVAADEMAPGARLAFDSFGDPCTNSDVHPPVHRHDTPPGAVAAIARRMDSEAEPEPWVDPTPWPDDLPLAHEQRGLISGVVAKAPAGMAPAPLPSDLAPEIAPTPRPRFGIMAAGFLWAFGVVAGIGTIAFARGDVTAAQARDGASHALAGAVVWIDAALGRR